MSNRIQSNRNMDDIDNDTDLLFSNVFVPEVSNTEVNVRDKQNFREFTENQQKNKPHNNFRSDPVVVKNVKDIIKTERISIIDIDTANRNKNAYPNPNDFKVELGKTFYNIKKVKLVSTSIPNTDQVITDTPIQIRNNTISWQNMEDSDLGIYLNVSITTTVANTVDITIPNHQFAYQQRLGDFIINISKSTSTPSVDGSWVAEIIDDNTIRFPFYGGISATASGVVDAGFPTYTVKVTPGNYTAKSIATEIQKQLNKKKRRNNSGVIFHYFTVDVSLDTDVITFRSYITKQLQNNPISTQAGTGVITVNSTAHGFKNGDYVLMIGLKNTGGITGTILNGLYQINVLDSDTFTYEVIERASSAADGAGATCKTGRPSEFRLLFNTSSSLIVYNIGFPDEDSSERMSGTLRTETLVSSAVTYSGNYIDVVSVGSNFTSCSIIDISGILTLGKNPYVRLAAPHGLIGQENVFIYYPFSVPILNGFFDINITGLDTFIINNFFVSSLGSGVGKIKIGGDRIQFLNFPKLSLQTLVVEDSTANTFRIEKPVGVEEVNINVVSILTEKVYVNHPAHGFNFISSITDYGNGKALITTLVNHGLTGKKYDSIPLSTTIQNTVDLNLVAHGLSTSDTVLITNSTSTPNINGTYVIQVITADFFRVSFIGGITGPGVCSVNKGDIVVISRANSVPNISTSLLGDTKYYIDKLTDTTFTIDTGFVITTPGTSGLLGRSDILTFNRIASSEPGGDNFAGIPLTALNGKPHKLYKIVDEDDYIINAGQFAKKSFTGGGGDIVISSQNHGYRTFQSNTDTADETGSLFRSISLEGENSLFLISPGLQTVYSPGNEVVGPIFAKILLNEPPGLLMFDSFISAPKDFSPPLAQLKDLELTMKRKDGYLFNFNNIDYSISIEITEIVDQIVDTGISGRTGASDIY